MDAAFIVNLASAYLGVGGLCALLFAGLVQRLEPSARGSSLLFRLMIVPGAVLLWPVIARRCVQVMRRRVS